MNKTFDLVFFERVMKPRLHPRGLGGRGKRKNYQIKSFVPTNSFSVFHTKVLKLAYKVGTTFTANF